MRLPSCPLPRGAEPSFFSCRLRRLVRVLTSTENVNYAPTVVSSSMSARSGASTRLRVSLWKYQRSENPTHYSLFTNSKTVIQIIKE